MSSFVRQWKRWWIGVLGFLIAAICCTALSVAGRHTVSVFAPYQVPPPKVPQHYDGYSFARAKYGLIISLDGVSYDAILRVIRRYPSRVPNLVWLANRGFLRPIQVGFPSMTWPNHVSIVTGQYPRHHGVLGNRWLEHFSSLVYPYTTDLVEPDRLRRTPALYDLVAQRGWKTAALNWPGTQRAKNIHYNIPEIMGTSSLSYRYTSKPLRRELLQMWQSEYRGARRKPLPKNELKRLLGRIGAKERIEMDMLMRDLAVRLVAPRYGRSRGKIPRLMLLHFLLPDSLLHKYGPSPWMERWGLEQMDRLIGDVKQAYLRARIWSKTAVFVTSDHGFARITRSLDIRRLLIRAGLSRYRSLGYRNRRHEKVMSFTNGHTAFIYIRPKHHHLAPKVIQALRNSRWRGCIKAVLTPDQYSKLGLPLVDLSGHKPRVGVHPGAPTLVAVSQPHCLFRTNHSRRRVIYRYKAYSYGAHGYFPHARPMWTFLLGAGPGIRRRGWRRLRKRRAYIVDIAPTMAYLMGLRWPRRWKGFGNLDFRLDGRILSDLLQNTDLLAERRAKRKRRRQARKRRNARKRRRQAQRRRKLRKRRQARRNRRKKHSKQKRRKVRQKRKRDLAN